MSNSNDIWNSILSMNKEIEITPTIQPQTESLEAALLRQPTPNAHTGIDFDTLNQVVGTAKAQELITAELVSEFDEKEEDYFEDEEPIQPTNLLGTFNLDVPVATGGATLTPFEFNLNIPMSSTEPIKRGRGRPPKAGTAQDVINLLPTNLNTEVDKRTSIINPPEILPPINQTATEVVTSIPKKSFKELAESLLRIAQTFAELGKE